MDKTNHGRESTSSTDDLPLSYSKQEQTFVAFSAILGFAFDFYNLIIIAFLLTQIQKSLSMTLTQSGLVVSLSLMASVIGGIGTGWLGDKIGRKNGLLISLALLAAGSILSAFAWDFTSLLVFRIIAGIGVGGEWGVGIVLFNEVWHSEGRGFGSGLVQAMSAVGTAIAVIVATLAQTHLSQDQSWRAAMLFGGLPIFLMIFVRAKMPESRLWTEYERLRKAGQLPPEKAASRAPIIETFRGASLKYFIFGMLTCGGYVISYQAISIFMPTLMMRDLHATPAAVRTATLWSSAFLATGLMLTGYMSDRIGRKRAVIAVTIVSIFLFIVMYLFGRVNYSGSVLGWTLFWCYGFWSLGQGSIGIFGPWYSELFPVELRSTGTSTTFTAGRLVGSVMPYVVPLIAAKYHDLFAAMMFGVLGAAFSLLFALFLPETAGRKFAVIEKKERGQIREVQSKNAI